MEERVRALESERAELRLQLDGKCRELRESEARWRDSKEQEVQKAWEAGSQQQRRLAAAFKAARELTAAKEAAAKEAHDSLANRFASRESRPEDMSAIEKQKRDLQDQQQLIEQAKKELKNRDDNDRIFGLGAARPKIPHCVAPLGGVRPCSARRDGPGRSSSERPRRPGSAHCSSRSGRSTAPGSDAVSNKSTALGSDLSVRCGGAW
jgi:hypothetical protein